MFGRNSDKELEKQARRWFRKKRWWVVVVILGTMLYQNVTVGNLDVKIREAVDEIKSMLP